VVRTEGLGIAGPFLFLGQQAASQARLTETGQRDLPGRQGQPESRFVHAIRLTRELDPVTLAISISRRAEARRQAVIAAGTITSITRSPPLSVWNGGGSVSSGAKIGFALELTTFGNRS
jgi:hypothetical protein